MADKTGISWAEATWPVTTGCTPVSPACDFCYAATMTSTRLAHLPEYAGLAVHGKFTGEVRVLPERLRIPLGWRKPRRIFVASMSDLFHGGVPDEFIAHVFAVMAATPRHTYLVLTKRHARMRSLLSSPAFQRMAEPWHVVGDDVVPEPGWPLPNVHLGVSVENQQWAGIRVPALRETPAAVRWLSCEPLLGPLDVSPYLTGDCRVNWIVAGGESGTSPRRTDGDWIRSLRDQCAAAGAAFHFKQAGVVLAREWGCKSRTGKHPEEWPEPFPQEYPHG
jgi:protein gp37